MKRVVGVMTACRAARSIVWTRAVFAMLLVLLSVGGPVLSAQGRNVERDERTLDAHLQARMHGGDDEPQPVIVTFRPGARRGVVQRLMAQGATITSEYGIIEAVAATLPPGLLRSLSKDRDVIAISSDATMSQRASRAASAAPPSTLLTPSVVPSVSIRASRWTPPVRRRRRCPRCPGRTRSASERVAF